MINYPDSIRVYDNFLSEENAYKIYATLSSLPQQWFSLMRGYIDENDHPQQSKTWWNIHGDKTTAPDYDPMGRMTYQYLATNDHQQGCNCVFCDMTTLFDQNPPPEAQGLRAIDTQLSLFRPGDYLSQHMDQFENRVWAFSYSLSVGWRPEWGGVLHAQDPDDGEWYAFPPVFNRLIMMDVTPGNTATNHYVSEIVPSCPVNRLTFSGWWGFPEQPGVQQTFEDDVTVTVEHDPVFVEEQTDTQVMVEQTSEPLPFDPEAEFQGEFNIIFEDDDNQLDEAS